LIKKTIYIVLGFASLGLGIAGIFLPLVPTTPLLLLAAWLFTRGSVRYRDWLLNHPVLGPYIHNYTRYHGITRKAKIRTITVLWATLGLSGYLLWPTVWVLILLLAVGIGVSWHLISLRTIRGENGDS
jgi:hypothetical protein